MGGDRWYCETYILFNVLKVSKEKYEKLIKKEEINKKDVYLNKMSNQYYILNSESKIEEISVGLDGPNSDCVKKGVFEEKEFSPNNFILSFLMDYRNSFIRMDKKDTEEDYDYIYKLEYGEDKEDKDDEEDH